MSFPKSPPQMRHVSRAWLHHDHTPETDELRNGKDLGKHVRQIGFCRHMYRHQYALIAKNFDLFLASVNVFELGLLCVVFGKGFSRSIVHLQWNRLGEVNTHLISNAR